MKPENTLPSRRRYDWGWLLAAALPLIGILPTFAGGIMAAADAPLHAHRIYAMGTMLANGELYPRWVPWFHLGYGYPIFNFYTPGVFYLGGLLTLLGLSAVTAFHLVAAAAWTLGSVGTYRLSRLFLPGYAALAAAALWSYAPSRLYEVWTQGSLPQTAAAAFVPWVFYTVVQGALHPSRRRAVWIGLAVAGLVFTHQPVTFITALYTAPLTVILVVWASRRDWRTLLPRAACVYGGVALAAGLTMIFLLPLALELQHVDAVNGRDDVVPYLLSNFLRPAEVFSYPFPNDVTDIRVEYPTTLGLVGGVLFALGVLALLRRRQFAVAALLTVALGTTIYMLLEPSLPVWLTIPYFSQIRFPARFLRVGAVILALGGGASLLWLPPSWRFAGSAVLILVILGTSLPFVYPSQPILPYENQSATTEVEFELETYTWGTTSYNEFNPRWGSRPPYDPPPELTEYAEDPLQLYPYDRVDGFELLDDNTFTITTPEARPIRVRQFYYPGWSLTLDGEPADIYPGEDVGMITVDVPAGTHTIELHYRGTWPQRIGTVLTLGSLLVVLGLFRTSGRAQAQTVRSGGASIGPRSALVGLVLIGGVAVANRLYVQPQTDWFRTQSAPTAPVYMEAEQYAVFGGDIALLGYTLNDTTISHDEVLPVTLYWHPLRDLADTHYRPVVQIVNLPVTEQWAVSQPFFPGGGFTRNYTPDRFTSDPHDLRLFDYAKPYAAHILVQMFDAETDEPLLLEDGSDRLLLNTTVQVDVPGVQAIQRLDHTFGGQIELWCKSIEQQGDTLNITLYWHAVGDISEDLSTLVHGLDANKQIVSQGDKPPVPEHPTSFWRPGQTLKSSYTLPADDAVRSVGIGLYTPDGTRLTVVEDGVPVPDGRVDLPLIPSDCEE